MDQHSQAKTANAPDGLRVFISYSRQDVAFVDRLQKALSEKQIAVSVDREDIEKGEEWWARIKQLINEADTIVFVVSPASVSSKICQEEVDFAESLNKRFIPIVIKPLKNEVVPAALARLNYIFFTRNKSVGATGKFDEAVDDLVNALRADIGWIREHTRLGELARRWLERDKPNSLVLRGAELSAAETWLTTRPPDAPNPSDTHRLFVTASRGAATTRQRIVLALSIAVVALSIGLSGLAYWQRNLAIQNQQLAEANELRAVKASEAADQQKEIAEHQRDEALRNESKALAAQADQSVRDGDAVTAISLALQGLPRNLEEPDRPVVGETLNALRRAFAANRLERTIVVGENRLNHAVFSPDGEKLVAAGRDGSVSIWDVNTGMRLHSWHARHKAVYRVAVSPDSELVAASYEDGSYGVWRIEDGQRNFLTELDTIATNHLTFSKSGSKLLFASLFNYVWQRAQIVDSRSGEQNAYLPFNPPGAADLLKRVLANEDLSRVAMVAYGPVQMWDGEKNTLLWQRPLPKPEAEKSESTLIGQERYLNALFMPDGMEVLLLDGTHVSLVDIQSGETKSKWQWASEFAVNAGEILEISPTGSRLVINTAENELGVFAARSGKLIANLRGHTGKISSAQFASDGELVATLSEDLSIRLWNAQTGNQLAILRLAGEDVVGMSFHPDGRRLMTYSQGGKIRIYGVRRDRERFESVSRIEGGWLVVDVNASGSHAFVKRQHALGVDYGLWQVGAETVMRTVSWPVQLRGLERKFVFSGDGRWVVVPYLSGKTDQNGISGQQTRPGRMTFDIVDTRSGRTLTTIDTDIAVRTSWSLSDLMAFDQAGERFAIAQPKPRQSTGSDADYSLTVWNAKTGETASSSPISPSTKEIWFSGPVLLLKIEEGDSYRVSAMNSGSRDVVGLTGPIRSFPNTFDRNKVIALGNGNVLITLDNNKKPQLIDLEDGKLRAELGGEEKYTESVLVFPDLDRVLIKKANAGFSLWDLVSGKKLLSPDLPQGDWINSRHSDNSRRFMTFTYSPDNDNYERGKVEAAVWDTVSGRLLKQFSVPGTTSHILGLNGSGNTAFVAATLQSLAVMPIDRTGQPVELQVTEGSIQLVSAIVDHTGSRTVTTDSQGLLSIWDNQTGRRIWQGEGYSAFPTYSMPGATSRLLMSFPAMGAIRIHDLDTGEIVEELDSAGPVLNGFLDPSARYLFVRSASKVRIWDLQARRFTMTRDVNNLSVDSEGFTPDGDRFWISGPGAAGELIETRTGKTLLNAGVTDVAVLHGDLPVLAFAKDGNRIEVWNTRSVERLHVLEPGGTVAQLRVSSSADMISVALEDRRVISWNIKGAVRRYEIAAAQYNRPWIGLSRSGRMVLFEEVTQNGHRTILWNVREQELVHEFPTEWREKSISFSGWRAFPSQDGSLVSVLSPDHVVRVFETGSGTQRVELLAPGQQIETLLISPDNRWLVANRKDGQVWIWDLEVGKALASYKRPAGGDVKFLLDGKQLAIGSSTGHVYIWNPETGDRKEFFSGAREEDTVLAVSSAGELLTTLSKEGRFRVWDVHSGEQLFDIEPRPTTDKFGSFDKRTLRFSADDRHLVLSENRESELEILTLPPAGDALIALSRSLLEGAGFTFGQEFGSRR